jgi:predicted metal-dependent hydrolase
MSIWRDKEEFKEHVLEWAGRLGIRVRSLALRPMRNKWASCSTAGSLNFNIELLRLDQEIGTYVIVHELLHFFVPNHGRLWKLLMRAYVSDYDRIEEKLRKLGSGRLTAPARQQD